MRRKDEQANAYLREGETTLEGARVLFERDAARFAPQIVKNAYDALEQVLSAGIAARGEEIPKRHHAKIRRYFEPLNANELERVAFSWYSRRSESQYVDLRGEELTVPSNSFDRDDAKQILNDAETILEFVRDRVQNG